MESNHDEEEKLLRKGKRANRLVIISLFLLALFWKLDPFFLWLFLGTTTYFLFLAWFYRRQSKPEEKWQMPPDARTGQPSRKFPLAFIIAGAAALIIFAAVSRFLSDTGVGPPEVEVKNEVPSDNASPDEAAAWVEKGVAAYNQNNYDSALFYYNRALNLDPTNQYALYDKALVYYAKKSYDRSVPLLLQCLRLYPEYADAYWLLGDNYSDRRRLDSAKICFEVAYEKGLRNGSFLQEMGATYEQSDRSKAISLYKESVQQDSTLAESYRKLIVLDPSNAATYKQGLDRSGASP